MFFKNKRNIVSGFTLLFLGFSFASSAWAQDADTTSVQAKSSVIRKSDSEIQVSGKVINAATKDPVNAAELEVEGYASAITNEDGSFSIKVPFATEVLKVKAWGFHTKEIAVKGRSQIDIELISSVFTSIHEKGTGIAGKGENINSPFSNSYMKEFYPVTTTSLEERMQFELGEIRSITRSGSAGMGANMFIRGYNSITGVSQPLIVIDGIPYETLLDRGSIISGNYINALANIDVEDIEDMSVIKDGYALYGVKGANGVISITTKRAKEIPSKITFTSSWGVNLSPKKIPVLNNKEYRSYLTEQLVNVGYSSQKINDLPYMNDDPSKSTYYKYHNNTDWQDEVYRDAMTQNYHIHVTGGDDIAKYAISLGYMDAQNTIEESSFNRFNTRFNGDLALTQDLLLSLGVAYSQTNKYLMDDGVSERTSPTYISLIKSPLVSPYIIGRNGHVSSALESVDTWGRSNPIALIERGTGENNQYRLNLNAKLAYDLSSDLKLSGVFAYDFDKLKETFSLASGGLSLIELRNDKEGKNLSSSNVTQFQSIYGGLSAEYRKVFNYIHKIDASVGLRYQSNTFEGIGGYGHNSPNNKIYLSNDLLDRVLNSYKENWKWASAYITANYALRNKYILSGSISRDGTSRAGKDERYGVFPSVGAMWKLSSESFMESFDFLNLFQLRASLGVVGSDDFGGARTVQSFGAAPYLNYMGLTINSLNNKDLKWETTTKTNLGLDFSMFNDRVSVSADVYNNKTKDLLTLQTTSSTAGSQSSILVNGGELENKGFELALNVRVIDTRDFKMNARASFAKYKNKVTVLTSDKDILTSYAGATVLTKVGQPIGVFYGLKTKGVFATTQDALDADLKTYYNNTDIYSFEAGDIHFEDVNRDGYIDEEDNQVIGDPNPDFYGSFALNFTYKAFDLGFVFSGVYGNDVYNYQRANIESMTGFNNQSTSVLNRWRGEGHVTNMPRATYDDVRGNSRFSDRWIEDGSFLRLKNVTLSWTSPKKIPFIDGLTVFASANNVFTITKYLGSDPEFSSSSLPVLQGIDTGLLSQGRSFMAGIKINL
ncbi:SusC/RagA family TonB-linked outer membrane protein [Dysgonomonas sp. 216]|uniref:SusC/RagA family TonB-linked outer membrane protein n=1 Tax=Dysgonomonas sp. 216 TaxID=2302934 RepID=UPI0013D65B21|nr:SusC/RagA family TonB-linked outer membrane protein [Dysgonomonas sp. 216]NDW18959.1 SusC/RagA family TonB-linked outer membrane protein [Dysgonomonas sp. 216]